MTDGAIRCNYCDCDDPVVIFEAGVAQVSRIVRCRRCGLMYANPRGRVPDCVAIEQYDPELTRQVKANARPRFEKERLQVRDYADTRAFLNRLYPRRGRLIEVGSGLGFQLAEFRREGWDVLGVEPNRGLCDFATDEHGIRSIPTILEDADLPAESADVVVMLHVIEHVPDPLGTLRAIYRVLKPGGHLVMETPRYDSLMFRLLGRRERSVSCDGHIYFFTTASLRNLYEKAGFATVEHKYVGRSLSLERLVWNAGVVSKSGVVQRALDKVSSRFHLNAVKLYLNLRDMQRVCVRKPLVGANGHTF